MESGFGYFATHDAVGPGEVARMVEERGHSMLLFAEHTHIPANADGTVRSPEPSRLARRYLHTYDLMVACTAAAVATSRIRVGSGICLVPQREPLGLAKAVASIDHLSGGRFVFGVGAGWNIPEIADHGIDPAHRFKILRERVLAMKQIWANDVAEYHGTFVDFDPVLSWPKPMSRPHPPILVGGMGAQVFNRVLDYADGWVPNYAPGVLDRVAELQRRAADLGRNVEVHMMSVPPDPAVVEACEKAGVATIMRWLPSAGSDRIRRCMDEFETAIAEMRGE
jgi:probable F420-dependent oxidoreductase